MLERMDIFGQEIPAFNLKGSNRVHTMPGGLMTFAIMVVMLIYASIKMIQLINRTNPNIAQFLEKDVYDSTTRLNLNEINYRVAFTVEGYHSRERKDDHKYVKYLVRIFGRRDRVEYETFIPYHLCTDEDWAQFSPPGKASADSWDEIKTDPTRGMFCLDWSEDILIYGNERNDNYQRIELVLVPCNYLHTHLGYKDDFVHEECVADLDK